MTTFTEKQIKYWHKNMHRKRRDPCHPVIRSYVEPKLSIIKKHVSVPSDGRILDVGAGNGYFSYYLHQWAKTTAVDYSPVILEANPLEDKRVMDARKLDFQERTFDLSFCHALLHHIDAPDRVTVVREMARVSKRYVVIIEPNRNNPLMAAFGALKKEEWGSLQFSLRYVHGLAEQAGLNILSATSYGILTPNRMPIPVAMLPLIVALEPFVPLGVTNIVIGQKK